MDGWIYLSTSRATVALEVRAGRVVGAPPYGRRWIGRPAAEILTWRGVVRFFPTGG